MSSVYLLVIFKERIQRLFGRRMRRLWRRARALLPRSGPIFAFHGDVVMMIDTTRM